MLEKFRQIGRVVVGGMVTLHGFVLAVVFVSGLLGLYNILVRGDFGLFLNQLFFLGVLVGIVLFIAWVGKDANQELRTMELQKKEQEEKGTDKNVIPDVARQEPWLFP